MRFSGREIESDARPYDVCVIGSGPSGLTTALELKSRGLRICVLESGGTGKDPRLDALKAVESEGVLIRPDSRERVLGGTSTTWSGFIAPLDPIDFEPRPGLHEGWPIGLDDIQPHIDRHGYRYRLPPTHVFEYRPPSSGSRSLPSLASLQPKIFHTQVPPFQYGKTFAYAFLEDGFDLYLQATVTRFERTDGVGVDYAVVRDADGQEHELHARIFVLAASAIESVRILFNSNGLGNETDQLGRYFMNHPKGDVAQVVFDAPLVPDHEILERSYQDFSGYVGLRLGEDIQRRDGHLNSYVRFEPLRGGGDYPKAKELSRAFKGVMKAAGKADAKALGPALLQMFRRADGLGQLVRRGWHRTIRPKTSTIDAARVRCFVEMEPLFDQRIELSREVDSNGAPLPKVRHFLSARALASVDALLDTVKRELQVSGVGRLERFDRPLERLLDIDASHHLGGARMGTDPATSVVDPSLRLHAADNLYLAGGAVFPTGGSANPTLTMVGLAIRLAETVATRLGVGPSAAAPRAGTGVIVVGAGRRVGEDIVPALEALAPRAHVQRIFATSRKSVFGLDHVHEVYPLSDLAAQDIAAAGIVYVAVPPKRLAGVLEALVKNDCSHLTLIVDTPAVDPKTVGQAYERFRDVVVAEDAAFLPWMDLLADMGKVRHVDIDRSGYRYHAVAMARALAGQPRPAVSSTRGKKNDIRIQFDGGTTARIRGPRDYDGGRLVIEMVDGKKIGSHAAEGQSRIDPILDGHFCRGFRVGERTVDLSEIESRLLGRFGRDDTVVSRMLDLKRVGLYRLLGKVVVGEPSYTLKEALEDNAPNW